MVPAWASLSGLAVLALITVWTARRDTLQKTVVLMYNFEPEAQAGYQAFHDGFDWLASSQRTWHLEAQGATADWKGSCLPRWRLNCTGASCAESCPHAATTLAFPVLSSVMSR
jgi:hypothetical protein